MARRIDTQAVISSIRLTNQAGAPTSPASGYTSLWSSSSGLHIVNSAGSATGPFGTGTGSGSATSSGSTGWYAAADTWSYYGADAPTYQVSVYGNVQNNYWAGMRLKMDQAGATKYFICSASPTMTGGSTIITMYGGTDYTIGAGSALSNLYYSPVKAPQGMPMDPTKWTVRVTETSGQEQTNPGNGTVYNINSLAITVPIGAWDLRFQIAVQGTMSTSSYNLLKHGLSTANNSFSDADLVAYNYAYATSSMIQTDYRSKRIALAAKTAYYHNVAALSAGFTSIKRTGDVSTSIIEAISAYL